MLSAKTKTTPNNSFDVLSSDQESPSDYDEVNYVDIADEGDADEGYADEGYADEEEWPENVSEHPFYFKLTDGTAKYVSNTYSLNNKSWMGYNHNKRKYYMGSYGTLVECTPDGEPGSVKPKDKLVSVGEFTCAAVDFVAGSRGPQRGFNRVHIAPWSGWNSKTETGRFYDRNTGKTNDMNKTRFIKYLTGLNAKNVPVQKTLPRTTKEQQQPTTWGPPVKQWPALINQVQTKHQHQQQVAQQQPDPSIVELLVQQQQQVITQQQQQFMAQQQQMQQQFMAQMQQMQQMQVQQQMQQMPSSSSSSTTTFEEVNTKIENLQAEWVEGHLQVEQAREQLIKGQQQVEQAQTQLEELKRNYGL